MGPTSGSGKQSKSKSSLYRDSTCCSQRPNTMNQMISTLYASNTNNPTTSSISQPNGATTTETTTSNEPDDQQSTKRKQNSEKPSKQIKKKRQIESSGATDIDGRTIDLFSRLLQSFVFFNLEFIGPDVEYSTTTFADFAASDAFKEVKLNT